MASPEPSPDKLSEKPKDEQREADLGIARSLENGLDFQKPALLMLGFTGLIERRQLVCLYFGQDQIPCQQGGARDVQNQAYRDQELGQHHFRLCFRGKRRWRAAPKSTT
jgi:hypothetical protein